LNATQNAEAQAPTAEAVELIRTRNEDRVLQVLEDRTYRWLKFEHGAIQSCMHKRQPSSLVLPYTRAMATALLFHASPRRILMLGLGGASFVRFLRSHYPDAALTVVENDAACVRLAQAYFGLPDDDPHIELIDGDAREVVPGLSHRYDLVIFDLFLAHGPPEWLREAEIFRACRARLSRSGVLSANLWADPDDADLVPLRGVSRAFEGRVLLLPVSGYRNLVALAFGRTPDGARLGELRSTARRLTRRWAVDMAAWLEVIESVNRVENARLVI
jgi:spermidine synthase